LRLFVAIDLDGAARDFVADAISRLQTAGLDARFQPREKWHVTLAFLGDTNADQYAAVLAALRAVAATTERFEVVLDAAGAFPDPTHPRVVWVGSRTSQPRYAACAEAVRAAFAPLGYRFDEDAVPHVTVCRLKGWRGPLPAVSLGAPAVIAVSELNLYESIADKDTTRYAIRERISLKETAT
jgi:RNA 2',3'-cyclic 3'-phosphodiesterase